MRYNERSLLVLSLLGLLSAVMSVLSVLLLFQLRSQQAAVKESPPSTSAVIGAPLWAVLLPVSAALAALSLTLHLSSAVVCLLHSYFSTEVCRGEQDTERYLTHSQPPKGPAIVRAVPSKDSSGDLGPPFAFWSRSRTHLYGGALKQLLDSLLVCSTVDAALLT